MSYADEVFATMGTPVLMDRFGVPITYTPPDGGRRIELTAVVGDESVEEQMSEDGRLIRRRLREITISTQADGEWGGVANPQLHSTISVSGVEYATESIRSQSSGVSVLKVVRLGVAEDTLRGYRKR